MPSKESVVHDAGITPTTHHHAVSVLSTPARCAEAGRPGPMTGLEDQPEAFGSVRSVRDPGS